MNFFSGFEFWQIPARTCRLAMLAAVLLALLCALDAASQPFGTSSDALGSAAGCWPVAGDGCDAELSGCIAAPSQENFRPAVGAGGLCVSSAGGVRGSAAGSHIFFTHKMNAAIRWAIGTPSAEARGTRGMMVTPRGHQERHAP